MSTLTPVQAFHAAAKAINQAPKTIRERAEAGDLDNEYSEYIMEHCHGDRIICNGDTLIQAIEDGYLFDAFVESMENPS